MSNPCDMQQLIQAFTALKMEVDDLRRTAAQKASDIKLAMPKEYDGSKQKFRGFINQCKLVFEAQPSRYPTDRSKVIFVLSLLTGSALSWATPLMESSDPKLDSLDAFLSEFQRIFDDPDRVRTAEATLQNLHQGNRSAASYASDFCQWARDTRWNASAQIHHFRFGLSEDIKDKLAFVDNLPETIDDFMKLCIRIDNRLAERRQERDSASSPRRYQTPTRPSTWNPQSPAAMYPPNNIAPSNRPPQMPNPSGPAPMQLDALRRHITDEEKHRRRTNGLCMYCGQQGHVALYCPAKRNKRSVVQQVSFPNTNPDATPQPENGSVQRP